MHLQWFFTQVIEEWTAQVRSKTGSEFEGFIFLTVFYTLNLTTLFNGYVCHSSCSDKIYPMPMYWFESNIYFIQYLLVF